LVDRYQDLLFRIALRMLGDEDSAADAAQVAWLSAFRKLGEFRGGRLKTWLSRITVNACYDELRLQHRRREVPLVPRTAEEPDGDGAFWLEDPTPGVEELVLRNEFDTVVQACLRSLAPVYRSMLILVDIEGMSYEEAAVAAHVPLGTVRSRLARARDALREQLRQWSLMEPVMQRWVAQPDQQHSVRCS
ncbi:MAG TPA: sigma-70 family RNA polymerase sigma factor, partial [Anaerolineales bacterium]|nr:sigma-70 family RNA polymerase sigma factor [Anaerolineales bacterium]